MSGFNADEIFEMAEQLERNGGDFYRAAAEQTTGDAQALLQRLAAMEDEHEKIFRQLREEAGKSIVLDPDGEGARYLQALMAGKVFSRTGATQLAGSESVGDLLDRAIGFEKDAIVFFTSMRGIVKDAQAIATLDRLIKEEVTHIADLQEQKVALGA